jgi:hypothetical protein
MCVGLVVGLHRVTKPCGHGHDIRPGTEPMRTRPCAEGHACPGHGQPYASPLGQRRCDACLLLCAAPVRLIEARAFPGSAIRASHDQPEGQRAVSWLSPRQHDWHGRMAADVLDQNRPQRLRSRNMVLLSVLNRSEASRPGARPYQPPGKRARRSGAEGKGQPSGQAPEARGETSKADIAAVWEKLMSPGASDCDITNAMTPITGGCGPHCTVPADRPGHAREAHCGCRECHGGGHAPVTLPGWGQTPERVVATRPGPAPALA